MHRCNERLNISEMQTECLRELSRKTTIMRNKNYDSIIKGYEGYRTNIS